MTGIMAYPEEYWLCFGSLTSTEPAPAETQLKRFKDLMKKISTFDLGSDGDRTHWAVRVKGKNVVTRDPTRRTHLDFLLGKIGVTSGSKTQFEERDICPYIEGKWTRNFGEALVELYHPESEFLDCFLRPQCGTKAVGYDDTVEISNALHGYFERNGVLADYERSDEMQRLDSADREQAVIIDS
jgi:hypothetical protein